MLFKSLLRASFLGKFKIIHIIRNSSDMSRIFVRSVAAEDRIQISFKYPPDGGDTVGGKQRVYNFDRLKSEEVERTLSRISANVSKVVNKRSKKKQAQEETTPEDVRVLLYDGENPVSTSEPNESAWMEGRLLKIEDMVFQVDVNVPTVKKISLPEPIMVGFAVRANVELEFAVQSDCQFLWYRLTAGAVPTSENASTGEPNSSDTVNGDQENSINSSIDAVSNAKVNGKPGKKRKKSIGSVPEWNKIHSGRTYTPSVEDVGCRLRLECNPRDGERSGESACADAKAEVVRGPVGLCPFETRHKLTEKLTDKDCLRFVTYNILADIYADSDYSRDFLFPYCPADKLSIDYRRQLILKELLGYNADIICLQEVDKKVFEKDLCPVLKEAGLSGLQRLKYGEVAEGTAIFYRDSRFRFLSAHDVCLSKAIQEDPLYADMLEKINKSEELKEKVFNRTSALQVALLEATDDSNRQILVCTVHQYFHPRAPHVRAIQTITCIRHIESVLSQLKLRGSQPAVVFCGDLNSYPEGGCHTFITQKHISSRHGDWYAGGKVEFIEGMDFSHGLDLISACGYPRYTNYVTGFASCLDYIYAESHRLEPTKVIPLPTHEDVTRLTALPNEHFPSDHLALVCELSWRDQNSNS